MWTRGKSGRVDLETDHLGVFRGAARRFHLAPRVRSNPAILLLLNVSPSPNNRLVIIGVFQKEFKGRLELFAVD